MGEKIYLVSEKLNLWDTEGSVVGIFSSIKQAEDFITEYALLTGEQCSVEEHLINSHEPLGVVYYEAIFKKDGLHFEIFRRRKKYKEELDSIHSFDSSGNLCVKIFACDTEADARTDRDWETFQNEAHLF